MMQLSPAQQHFQRTVAAKAAASAGQSEPIAGSDYQLIFAKLVSDKQRLKQIQSVQRKIDVKREMLPSYQPWIDGALEAGLGAKDEVLTTMMVWHIDTGDLPRALQIAEYVIAHNLPLPDQYNRDAATLLLDDIPDAFLQALAQERPATANANDAIAATLAILQRVEQLTANKDAPDQARAKLYKALGYACLTQLGEGELTPAQLPAAQTAMRHLLRALELFNGIGVKKDIERLERRIKKTMPPDSNGPA
jgi:hypothetical protein